MINITDLPNDILTMIYELKEKEERLTIIEKYARSNFKFVMKDIKERFINILEDKIEMEYDQQVLPYDIIENQDMTDDSIEYDTKYNFDNMTANISDGEIKFRNRNIKRREMGEELFQEYKKYYRFQ